MELQFFEPREPTAILHRRLPHWSQAGTITFVTFRLHDSMPRHILQLWVEKRAAWLSDHGIAPGHPEWQSLLHNLAWTLRQEFHQYFSTRWHQELDQCYGSCVLRDPENSLLVADAILYFDQQKYWVTDLIEVPNHVHMLVAFPDEDALLKQCEHWKRYTARFLNKKLGLRGRFWQQDGFDHLVRSLSQFEHFRDYIASNPREAGLRRGEYQHYSVDPGAGASPGQ